MRVTIAIMIAAMAISVTAVGESGNYRTLPRYKTGSGADDQPQYQATAEAGRTYTTPSYQLTGTNSTFQNESIYRKAYSRSSYKPSSVTYTVTTPSYSKSSYKASTASYVTEPIYYKAAESGRFYSSKPANTGSPYSSPVYTTTTSASYSASQRYPAPSYSNKQDSYDDKPMPYEFNWGVKDTKSYNDYSHQQESNGKVVSGNYRILLPDGRTQIVTYKADENGYVANVAYEGEAKYNESKSVYKSADAVYQTDVNYTKIDKPIVYTKAPAVYRTDQNPVHTSRTIYATKLYDVPVAYTTPSY